VIQGRVFKGALLIHRGDVHGGVDLLRAALGELRETGFVQGYPRFLAMLADGLRRAGWVQLGNLAIDEGLAHGERREELWCVAELLRMKGELLLLQGLQPRRARTTSARRSPARDSRARCPLNGAPPPTSLS
jgi:hypothetical protein